MVCGNVIEKYVYGTLRPMLKDCITVGVCNVNKTYEDRQKHDLVDLRLLVCFIFQILVDTNSISADYNYPYGQLFQLCIAGRDVRQSQGFGRILLSLAYK